MVKWELQSFFPHRSRCMFPDKFHFFALLFFRGLPFIEFPQDKFWVYLGNIIQVIGNRTSDVPSRICKECIEKNFCPSIVESDFFAPWESRTRAFTHQSSDMIVWIL